MKLEKLYSVDLIAEEVDEVSGLTDGTALPIIVMANADETYTVIDGCHRLAGMRKARETMITCVVVTKEEIAGCDYEEVSRQMMA